MTLQTSQHSWGCHLSLPTGPQGRTGRTRDHRAQPLLLPSWENLRGSPLHLHQGPRSYHWAVTLEAGWPVRQAERGVGRCLGTIPVPPHALWAEWPHPLGLGVFLRNQEA